MTRLRELLDEHAPPLHFVRRDADKVHIVAPSDPAQTENAILGRLSGGDALVLALAQRRTVCGLAISVVPGGRGKYVGEFPDEDLCGRCHRMLGPAHQHLAFEHPQPGDPA